MRIVNVILAAGLGTRMKSALPKALHPLMGKTLVEWAVETATQALGQKPVVVVGYGREQVEAVLGDRATYVVQSDLLGTGHAVMQAEAQLRGKADAVIVTYVDMPLLRAETLRGLAELYKSTKQADPNLAISMLTLVRDDSQGFGRIVRNAAGEVEAIVEEVDCTPEQRLIQELNPGIYCFDAEWLWTNLSAIPRSAKGEYYLTDLVAMAVAQGRRVVTQLAPTEEVEGINTRVHLAAATAVARQRILERHMLNGVTIVDPASTYIEDSVEIEGETTIMPNCVLQGRTRIGAHSLIGPGCQIVDTVVGKGCRITYSVLEEAKVGDHCEIGPFGHLRKGAHLDDGVHMGNFGEVKNSYLGPGVKMGHFSYIGDAHIESDVNIGAGTITCNYDGKHKNKTVIGKGAFIGSDTLFVAPVEVGAGARTGAGSVVTRDVPPEALVYGVPARPSPRTKHNTDG